MVGMRAHVLVDLKVVTMDMMMAVMMVDKKVVMMVDKMVVMMVELMVDKKVAMLVLQDTNRLCMNKHLEYYSINQSIERLNHLDIHEMHIQTIDNS